MRTVFHAIFFIALLPFAATAETWQIVLSPEQQQEEAIRLVVADLQEAGAAWGLEFVVADDSAEDFSGNLIVAGDASRNRWTARLAPEERPEEVADPEGYALRTYSRGSARHVVVAGGSLIGDVYGLYWLWDRIRVTRTLPDLNEVRIPAMKLRLSTAWGRRGYGGSSKAEMHAALRGSFNWVAGPPILDLVPWNAEPEATANAAKRESVRELIQDAHKLHLKYLSFANAFTAHPSLLEDLGATLNPCDPKFWDAVQEKFRMLFRALPELDAVELCNDDISGFWENYLAYDLTRETPECDWSYEKRFNTFVRKVHEVVVEEFGKTYFHFTWGLREHEVHVQPDVFRAIFDETVPTENLYLMPKVTRGDRWWHQPYNRTFNQTPHDTIVLFETMNYHESGAGRLFPTFSGEYFQRGIQTFLVPEHTNLRGAAALIGSLRQSWDTTGAYNYALYRLWWNPYEPIEQIAEDFCAIHFGPEAAPEMARVYLLSPAAHKYGLYIEPISYGQFNSFLHMRVGTFPADGYPAIDHGKEHLVFLRDIYLRCVPWRTETLRALEHGRSSATEMYQHLQQALPKLKDPELAAELENRLTMTRRLIDVNISYVETIFAYFDYQEAPSPHTRQALGDVFARATGAREAFMSTPNFNYDLYGVNVLLDNARDVLEDFEAANARLEHTPSHAQLIRLIAAQQERYQELLKTHQDSAVHFARFEILVDGLDMLVISGDQYTVEHIRWDGAHVRTGEILIPLPKEVVTVIPHDIESRPIHPFVLEQPTAENGYTARIYMDDAPGGHGWMRFDLYYLPGEPETHGLAPL